MKVASVKEIFNTRYFYVTFVKDLEYLWSTVAALKDNPSLTPHAGSEAMQEVFDAVKAGEDIAYDFAECKITSSVTEVIKRYSDSGYIFIDSKDSYRNSIFAENAKRYQNAQIPVEPLPIYDLQGKIVPYIGELDGNKVYKAKVSSDDLDFYLIILASMVRPDLKFVMDGITAKILKIVAALLHPDVTKRYGEFFYATDDGIEILTADGDGYVQTQIEGRISVRDAASRGALVPTVFGKEVLYQKPGWHEVFERVLQIVNDMRTSRSRTLVEALTEEVPED